MSTWFCVMLEQGRLERVAYFRCRTDAEAYNDLKYGGMGKVVAVQASFE